MADAKQMLADCSDEELDMIISQQRMEHLKTYDYDLLKAEQARRAACEDKKEKTHHKKGDEPELGLKEDLEALGPKKKK